MIKNKDFNRILEDLTKISKDISVSNADIKSSDFVARLVICYEDRIKYANYNEIMNGLEAAEAAAEAEIIKIKAEITKQTENKASEDEIKALQDKLSKAEAEAKPKIDEIKKQKEEKKPLLKLKAEYNEIQNIISELNKIDFSYKCKANKYFYLLNVAEFEKVEDFKKVQQLFAKKDKKGEYIPVTINIFNLKDYKNLIDYILQTLKNK